MKVKDLLHRIDNVNTTPIEVDDFRTNTVYTVYSSFSEDMLSAAKLVVNTFKCLNLDMDVYEEGIHFESTVIDLRIVISIDKVALILCTEYTSQSDILYFSKISLKDLINNQW